MKISVSTKLVLKRYYILLVTLLIVLINSFTIFMLGSMWYKIIIALYLVVDVTLYRRKLYCNLLQQKIWLAFLVFAVLNLYVSIYTNETKDFLTGILIFSLLMFYEFSINFLNSLINVMNICTFVCALSILISVVYPGLITDVFSFLIVGTLTGRSIIQTEIANGAYSGLLCEKLVAAYAMCFGFVISFSRYVRYGKNKYMAMSAIYILAILLTGKRIAIIVPIIFILFTLLNSTKKTKKRNKILKYMLFGVLATAVFIIVVPQTRNMVLKVMFVVENMGGELDVTNSRSSTLWPIVRRMFAQSPMLGTGLNTFNTYMCDAYSHTSGILSRWSTHAHCIYMQLIAEIGIVGVVIVFSLFIVCLYKCCKLYRKINNEDARELLLVSMGMQILFLAIGITENTFYSEAQLCSYIVGVGIMNSVEKQIESKKRLPKES